MTEKYPRECRTAKAVYNDVLTGNPLLDALPQEAILPQDLASVLKSVPAAPMDMKSHTPQRKLAELNSLRAYFHPMPYMYRIYTMMLRAIQTTYSTQSAIDSIARINSIFRKEPVVYQTQVDSGSILGVPGVGKTSTIIRTLRTMPQVIEHEVYNGEPFFCKQILYLHISCPADCSIKTVIYNIFQAIDQAIGVNIENMMQTSYSQSISALTMKVKILCMTYHVGVILIDEIQNVVNAAKSKNQVRPLVKFLVELTNDANTSIYFVGTPLAEELFLSQEHLKRRTRGLRLLPMKPDATYHKFLYDLWPFQYTDKAAPLNDRIANIIYDHSGGIPAYITKIFQEAQTQAIFQNQPCINVKILQEAIKVLAIEIPNVYPTGVSISDFEVCGDSQSNFGEYPPDDECVSDVQQEIPRMYANKRGRKPKEKDASDLVAALEQSVPIGDFIQRNKLLEERYPC